ncbi:MAG: branched-chain amino acid ABC transporter permease [Caldilineae bacterium]|nr:MAG: branched-chain amino acid ABC transporter permease [Caldilineae bacterium]
MAIRPSGDFDTTYEHDMSVFRRPWQLATLFGFLALMAILPFLPGVPAAFIDSLAVIGIFIVAAQGLGILTGYAGQISLGQAAFMMVGGYISGFLTTPPCDAGLAKGCGLGWPFLAALPVAALGAGLVGILFGLPSLRIKGFYLAMATLAAQFILPWVFRNSDTFGMPFFGGADGLLNVPPPDLFKVVTFNSTSGKYLVVLATVIVTTYAMKNLSRTRVGRAFVAIRDNDLAAELLGVNVFLYKLQAFFLSALYAGVAGALWAHKLGVMNPEALDLVKSVEFLAMVIVGGLGSALGPIFGAFFFQGFNSLIKQVITPQIQAIFPDIGGRIVGLNPLVFGLALALFLIFEPHGLAHRWEVLKASWRLRPFSH